MTNSTGNSPDRQERLQRELRANLRRRKDQARARRKPAGPMGALDESETNSADDVGGNEAREGGDETS